MLYKMYREIKDETYFQSLPVGYFLDLLINYDKTRKFNINKELTFQEKKKYTSEYHKSIAKDQSDELIQIFKANNKYSSCHVYDIATGGGYTAIAISPFVKFVYAFDKDLNMVKHAVKNVSESKIKNIEVLHCEIENIEKKLKDINVNIITMRGALRHFSDPLNALRICHKLLDRNGEMFIIEPITSKGVSDIWTLISYFRTKKHLWYWNFQELGELLKKGEFRINNLIYQEKRYSYALDDWLKTADYTYRDELKKFILSLPKDILMNMGYEKKGGKDYFSMLVMIFHLFCFRRNWNFPRYLLVSKMQKRWREIHESKEKAFYTGTKSPNIKATFFREQTSVGYMR